MTCRPECTIHRAQAPAPEEPALGTWVKDRFGGTHVRTKDSDGNIGWACAPTSFYVFGKWEAMWEARGPLEECGPWGASLTDGNPRLWR